MEFEIKKKRRKNGVYYTPHILAKHLADPLIDGSSVSVLDPSYGNGSLLLAAEEIFNEKSKRRSSIKLSGCDIHPVNGLLKHLPQANLIRSDFFEYDENEKFDLILTNPPYIRHQSQNQDLIKKYRSSNPDFENLSGSADLWAYFIIQATCHLKEGGSIGAILPWAFLQADYAQKLRKWLLDRFGEINVLGLNKMYFEHAQERVVLLWLKNYGSSCKNVKYSVSKNIENIPVYKKISKKNWQGIKIFYNPNNKVNLTLSKLRSGIGFSEFGQYADVRIGVVTGANKYFIKTCEEAANLGFNESQLHPIITSAKELPEFIRNGSTNLKRLICLNEEHAEEFADFIINGKSEDVHLRSHSKQRKPWYSIKKGKAPDAFFPYRVSKIPYLIINNSDTQSTNSIHRVYFKGLNKTEMKWIQVSLFSIYGQISLEAEAKTYGRGMLKVEPGALKKVLVYVKNDKQVDKPYRKIIKLLKEERKDEAIGIATNFINEYLEVPNDLKKSAQSIWEDFQTIRRGQSPKSKYYC